MPDGILHVPTLDVKCMDEVRPESGTHLLGGFQEVGSDCQPRSGWEGRRRRSAASAQPGDHRGAGSYAAIEKIRRADGVGGGEAERARGGGLGEAPRGALPEPGGGGRRERASTSEAGGTRSEMKLLARTLRAEES